MSRKRYPLRVPREAHGIRAQDLRTLVRSAWWARRWIAALEAMRLGARLGRGRQYAVGGQVTELVLEGPHVEARVTGSRPDPYRVALDFTAVSPARTAVVGEVLRAEAMPLARLLTDDLPTEVEDLLRAEGVPLFPKAEPLGLNEAGRPVYDVRMKCSCPDWARPCKHIVSVLLLLGEEIARHPAALLALRGIDVDELVPDEERVEGTVPAEVACTKGTVPAEVTEEGDAAPLLRRLGPIPFWRGGARCVDALAKIYGRVRPVAVDAARGRSVDLR